MRLSASHVGWWWWGRHCRQHGGSDAVNDIPFCGCVVIASHWFRSWLCKGVCRPGVNVDRCIIHFARVCVFQRHAVCKVNAREFGNASVGQPCGVLVVGGAIVVNMEAAMQSMTFRSAGVL